MAASAPEPKFENFAYQMCFVKVGIQLVTSEIINISHCNSILDSNK